MKLIILSNCGPFDRFLIGRLHQLWPVSLVLRPTWDDAPTLASQWSKLRRAPLRSALSAFSRRYNNWNQRRLDQRVSRLLFGNPEPPALDIECRDIPHQQINQAPTVELLRDLCPDVLLVSSGPLLKPGIFSLPNLATINVHRGISPFYRGDDTLFWPLYHEDYDRIGITLHKIDRGIDTGSVLAQGYPAIVPADTEATLLAKGALLAVEMAAHVLDVGESGPLTGCVQNQKGRFFACKDRRPWHDLSLQIRRAGLDRRPPQRPARIESFCGIMTQQHELQQLPSGQACGR